MIFAFNQHLLQTSIPLLQIYHPRVQISDSVTFIQSPISPCSWEFLDLLKAVQVGITTKMARDTTLRKIFLISTQILPQFDSFTSRIWIFYTDFTIQQISFVFL